MIACASVLRKFATQQSAITQSLCCSSTRQCGCALPGSAITAPLVPPPHCTDQSQAGAACYWQATHKSAVDQKLRLHTYFMRLEPKVLSLSACFNSTNFIGIRLQLSLMKPDRCSGQVMHSEHSCCANRSQYRRESTEHAWSLFGPSNISNHLSLSKQQETFTRCSLRIAQEYETYSVANLKFDESSSILLVIEPLIILKGGNLLIVQAVWRLTPHHNRVSLQDRQQALITKQRHFWLSQGHLRWRHHIGTSENGHLLMSKA